MAVAGKGSVDFFEAFPFGKDQRGRSAEFNSCSLAAHRCDPAYGQDIPSCVLPWPARSTDVELHTYDGTGDQDWWVRRIAHRVGSGSVTRSSGAWSRPAGPGRRLEPAHETIRPFPGHLPRIQGDPSDRGAALAEALADPRVVDEFQL